nr:chlorophyll a-b binding protein [Tanacetum cinerariifolium]
MVTSSSSLCTANNGLLLKHPSGSSFSNNGHSVTPIRWGLRREFDSGLGIRRTSGKAIPVANPNVTIASGKAKKEVIMVDPAEAKRLAAKQMETIKKKQTFKRRRQIEAINGAWAMLGLTAGLVIEGQTGNGILAQLTGYWAAVTSFFGR